MVDATEVPAKARREVSKRSFVDAEGNITSRVTTDSLGFKIGFADSDEVVEAMLSEFAPGVINAAALFGLVTSITNTFGGIKGPIEESIQAARERLETFLEGDWTSDRQSGPRSSQILEAAVAVRADAGKDTSDEWKESFMAKYKADEEFAKSLNKDAAFAAKLAAIKAKAAAERAERLGAKAQEAPGTSLLD